MLGYVDYLEMKEVVHRAYVDPFSIQSQFFRNRAAWVCAAASLGLITTALPAGGFDKLWRVTHTGLLFMEL